MLPDEEIRIGDFRIVPSLLRLEGPAKTLQVRRKEMLVLHDLVVHEGHPRSSSTIRQAVWGEQAVVDHIVAGAVYELRKAFREVSGDDDVEVIRSIKGQGYVLTLPVDRPASSAGPQESSKEIAYTAYVPTRSSRRIGLVIAAAAVLVVAGVVIVRMVESSPPPVPKLSQLPRIAFVPASQIDRAIGRTADRLSDELRGSLYFKVVSDAELHDCLVEVSLKDDDGDDEIVVARIPAPDGDRKLILSGSYDYVHRELHHALEDILKTRAPSIDAWIFYEQGHLHFRVRDYDRAIASLRAAIRVAPEYAHAYALLAHIYNILGDGKQAQREIVFARQYAQNLSKTDQLRIERRQAQIDGDLESEFTYLKDLHRQNPQEPEWNFYLGWFYNAHLRDCGKSRERLLDAVRFSNPPEPYYHAYLSDVLIACGQIREALDELQRYVDLEPGPAAREFLAYAHILAGDYELADHELREILNTHPDFHPPLATLGLLELVRGRYRRAEASFNAFRAKVESPSEETQAHTHLARVYLAEQRFDEAVSSSTTALGIRKSDSKALWIRGLAHLRQGELDLARESANAIKVVRDRSFTRYDLEYFHHLNGQIAIAEGDYDAAVESFQLALENLPDERALFLDSLARAYFAKGDLVEAAAVFRQALEVNPNFASSLCGLAEVEEQQGYRGDAVAQYERCLGVLGADNEEAPLAARARERLRVLR